MSTDPIDITTWLDALRAASDPADDTDVITISELAQRWGYHHAWVRHLLTQYRDRGLITVQPVLVPRTGLDGRVRHVTGYRIRRVTAAVEAAP